MNQLKISFILLVIALSMSIGCTKEDLSVCNADIYLKIGFLNETKSHSSIDTINVYLYDNNTNVLVNQFSEPFADVMANDGLMRVDISKSGNYNFVVLADASTDYFNYESIDSLEAMTVALDDRGQSLVNWQIGNIYHGLVEGAIIKDHHEAIFDVVLTQNNNDIYIQSHGLPSLVQMVDLRIDYDNKVINSSNSTPIGWLHEDCKVSYSPIVAQSSRASLEDHDFRFNTLRLFYSDRMDLHYTLTSHGGPLKTESVDLLSIIKKNPKYSGQLDLDIEYEFFVDLNFGEWDGKLTLISVTIDEWTVIVVKPEI